MPKRKLKFPATLESVLRFILPKKRPEDRMKIYREFVRGSLLGERGRMPTDDEVVACIEVIRKDGFQSMNHVELVAEFMLNWLPRYEAHNRRKRAKAGAAGRWPKKPQCPN